MHWWQAIILGVIEGVTEFLPVSSTGHLTVAEKLMGMNIDTSGVVAFTAVIQIGAILAAVIYFWQDIRRVAVAWLKGLTNKKAKKEADYKFGWAIIIGSIPIALAGLLLKDFIEKDLRSLWFVAVGLILWSVVMWLADRMTSKKGKKEETTTWQDTLVIGGVQCLALVPGVSRSGATISAALFRGFDRTVATRLSFFLGIPALVAAGGLEAITQFKNISHTVGWGATSLGIIVSFIVGYASIAWLLRFIASNTFAVFIKYRLVLGGTIILLILFNIL